MLMYGSCGGIECAVILLLLVAGGSEGGEWGGRADHLPTDQARIRRAEASERPHVPHATAGII